MTFFAILVPLAILAGLVFALVSGFRALSAAGPELEAADIAKSAAINVGLFIALIACTVGSIDLLQSFVEEQRRFAGSSSDLARGLSLLIVGLPTFGLLLRSITGRYQRRASEGDNRAHRGWSTYLVAALTTSLIGTLTSVAQITDRITDEFDTFEPAELMQLIVWFACWALHWFVLRPRYRVLGDIHLALGSIIGLSWFLAGAAAVIFRILQSGYDATFDESLARSTNPTFWLVVAVVGAAVWVWHWLLHFNGERAPEGSRRRSSAWYFTVVIAGVLPGVITIFFSLTAMASGILIWFLGSAESSASDFFEPAPGLITALFLGLVTWAYHRWELDREGTPTRNESLRFHDYAVVGFGLIGVVGSLAALVSLFIDTVVVSSGSSADYLGGSFETDNALITVLTVLVASAFLWWHNWNRIESYRVASALNESDSIWRKLYLIIGFGVGGLALTVSLVWVVFAVLRDLFDGQLGSATIEDLATPLGWTIAVVGAVWFHLQVWNSDRAVIAAHAPEPVMAPEPDSPPVASPSTYVVRAATAADAGELFTLRRAVLLDEVVTTRSLANPETTQSFATYQARPDTTGRLVVVRGSRIVGSIDAAGASEPIVAPDQPHEMVAQLLRSHADSASISPSS